MANKNGIDYERQEKSADELLKERLESDRKLDEYWAQHPDNSAKDYKPSTEELKNRFMRSTLMTKYLREARQKKLPKGTQAQWAASMMKKELERLQMEEKK